MTKKRTPSLQRPQCNRQASLSSSRIKEFDGWVHEKTRRGLSVPDLHKLSKEWELYQQSDNTPENRIIDTRMQIDLLNIRVDTDIKRPQIRLKMGPATYYSKIAHSSRGNWNEGFVFVISYHAQLFNTIEFDLYDKPHKHWSASHRHVGKAKLKISTLASKSDVFVTFLPIYEYQLQHLLPSELQSTLLETDIIDPKLIGKKTGDQHLIGSIQIRVRYHFQEPTTTQAPNSRKKVLSLGSEPLPGERSSSIINETNLVHGKYSKSSLADAVAAEKQAPLPHDSIAPTKAKRSMSIESNKRCRALYGRGDLAQNESFVDNVFKDRLEKVMSQHISYLSETPTSSSSKVGQNKTKTISNPSKHSSLRPILSSTSSSSIHGFKWILNLFKSSKSLPKSSSGKRYGFLQNDSDDSPRFNPNDKDNDSSSSSTAISLNNTSNSSCNYDQQEDLTDRIKNGARKKAQHIINSVNFGDRNFASQWMQDSFNDVALSYPLMDRLIGFIVSKQTQAMVRAIVKTANSFGQGFRVTGMRLLKAALLLQRFYETLPRPTQDKCITDPELIDNACHYFSFALIAYGWRGLCYLGIYGQYVRGLKDRHSNRLAIIRFLKIHPEDLLGYEYALRKGASFQPSYFIVLDRKKKAIVLSIRGTWSLYDAITDLVCEYMPWKGGLVHSGMLASAQWFYTNIIPQIFRYIHHHRNSLEKFIITGHSLGGGTASLLTMMVADHVEELRELSENRDFVLQCYSYAPAAVSSPDLCERYSEYINSFVCQDDVVGRVSYGTAMKLKELVLDTISAYGTLGGFRKTMTDPKAQKVCFDIIARRRSKLNNVADSTYPSLYMPGKIIHIRRTGNDGSPSHNDEEKHANTKATYSLHYITHTISDEMKLTKTCIEDHMLNSYQDSFKSLQEQFC